MRSLTHVAATAVLALAIAPDAQARANAETAEEIRRALKVWIGQNVQSNAAGYTVELDGQITVLPDGDLYRVTLPAGRAVMHGDGNFQFGETTMDLTPLDNGWYEAEWLLPDGYRFENTYGPSGVVTIGDQRGQGVFAPDFQTMMSMDAELTDVTVTDTQADGRFTVDRVTVVAESTEVSPGIFDQESVSRIEGVRFTANDGRNSFELADAVITVISDDGRLAELAEFQRQSNALTLQIDGSNDPDQINAAIASFADLIESMPTLLAGAEMEMRLGEITIQDYGDQFTMDGGTFTMNLDGLDQEQSDIAIGFGADGMQVSDPEIAKLFPRESRFRLALTGLPNSELVQLGIGTMRSMGTTDPAMAMLMASGGLQQALTTANSTVEIGPIRIASDTSSIDLQGVLRPEASSPFGVVGEADMVATGLDTLIAELQAIGGDDEAIQVLTLMQTLGAQAPDADGRSVRTYEFRLDSAGNVLLNGSDIMPLIGGMQ